MTKEYVCEFYGGDLNRKVFPLCEVEKMTEKRSKDLSEIRARGGLVHRAELDNKPVFDEYAGPMWEGITSDGKGRLRYESWELNELLSR